MNEKLFAVRNKPWSFFLSGTNVIAVKYLSVPCFYLCTCDGGADQLGSVSDFLPIEFLRNRATGTRNWSVLPQSIANVKNAWHDATCGPTNIFIPP